MQYPQQFWNDRYESDDYVYGTAPNEFLKSQLDPIQEPGRLLLLAEGEGRNAVYAAEKGWQVTAVDFSDQGRGKALALAASRGVSLDYHVMDVRQFDFEANGPWDAIGLIYSHFPSDFRSDLFKRCLSALRTGGCIIFELFTPAQLNYTSGGPKDLSMLYAEAMAKADFSQASSLSVEETNIELNEGPGHTGTAAVVRGVAIR